MALADLRDIIDIEVWADLESENDPTKTELYQSGIIAVGDMFNNLANAPGEFGEINFWRPLDSDGEANYSTDTNAVSTPDKIVQDTMSWRKNHLNKSWGSKDLVRELQSNTDIMQEIRNSVGYFWTRQWQQRLVATAIGVFNANVANSVAPQIAAKSVAGDMVNDISLDNAGAPAAINLFNRDGFIDTAFTMGDRAEGLSAMVMHSTVHKTVVKLDDHEYIMDSTGTTRISTYMGRPIVVDDSCPVIAAGTSGFRYLTMLFGPEAFAYGLGSPTVPVEVDRKPDSGNGGGEEVLYTRETFLLHPLGFKNTNAVKNGPLYADGVAHQQTLADLQNATNWVRTHLRKNVPLAYFVTNG